ncbi:TrkH family potassium uptake protein [Nanchangia anserum]|uniref:TrkH family potassium uptake protein n=1 Tax=Nanchangia anserum TaxID=2692125 RepID=A0A8I0GC90_9ACTO|nr:potassium transporter TrkG [Nanchangia anserum]MBD3689351.1 TrkH family potassium uptake protein [Nanchangia anserum]QOX81557.1 TrkH family potassium uptake protein [Nanchangia anserum]
MASTKRLGFVRDYVNRVARSSPARLALGVFALIIAVETLLLQLPAATATGKRAPFIDSLFQATSAVCVTGLTTTSIANDWSFFGQLILAFGMKIGGLGVMTMASILALAVSRHIGLTQRMLAAMETKSEDRLGAVGSLIRAVIVTSLSCEILIFAVLLPRFLTLHEHVATAVWHAFFTALSIFNNVGFVALPEGLEAHVGDWWLITPVIAGTFAGALGFPVMLDLRHHWRRPRDLTLHSKLTLTTYVAIFLAAALIIAASEWNNPDTFGPLALHEKIQTALLFGVNSRSSGLTTIDVSQMTRGSWFLLDILMFIGGGSASTAGGIKVTTVAVMTLAIIAEARGDQDIEAFGRRVPPSTLRLAVGVVGLGTLIVAFSVFFLLLVTPYTLDVISFEVISAFATTGLSVGITADLPLIGKYWLVALMFAGRTGTMTLAAALALRDRRRLIRMPEERPTIG